MGWGCGDPPSSCSSASSPESVLEEAVPAHGERLARRAAQARQKVLTGRDEGGIPGRRRGGRDALCTERRLAAVERELEQDVVLALVEVEIDTEPRVAAGGRVRLDALGRRDAPGTCRRSPVVAVEVFEVDVPTHELAPGADVERQPLAGI